nr:reverse transcriptase domain-containing protein [Tanacetum cinerariifolium]
MAKEDEEKTAFITSQGIFCYLKMSFELKEARATYQCLVDKAFQKQIGQNLEVYVEDLVIKSCTEEEVIRDIEETFKTIREINMKLYPKKCTFGMREGTPLRYKVNPDGLKVFQDKVEAVLSLPSPKCLKDVQKINGKLESLNRFLSKSAKKSLPFFKTLNKPRTSVKGQILADFIVERPEDDPHDIAMEDEEAVEVDVIKNDKALGVSLDLLEEKIEQAAIQEARTKSKMEKYYNVRVRNTSFHLGDLVYQNNKASHTEDGGKLGPKWEGPYEVTKALGKGAYKLRDRNRNTLPLTWNIYNLKKCYMHEM